MIACVLMAALLGASPVGGGDDPLQKALLVLAKIDASKLAIDYQGETLQQVLADLDARLPVPVRADWDALRRMGVTSDDRVDLRLPGSTGAAVLAGLAMSLGDEIERPVFEVFADQMILTSPRATESMRLTAVYDVRDLLASPALIQRLEGSSVSEHAPAKTQSKNEDDRKQPTDEPEREPLDIPPPGDVGHHGRPNPLRDVPSPQSTDPGKSDASSSAGERLINTISDHVDPDAWMNFGGSRAKISDQNGVLVVTATPATHRRLQEALRRLREVTSTAIHVQALIMDVSQEKYDRLIRQYDRRSTLLASMLMSDAATVTIWKTSDPASIDRPLTIESQGQDRIVRLSLTPRLQMPTGICSVDIDAATIQAEDRRTVKSTVTFAGDDRGAVLELPGAQPAGVVRVVILLLDRG